MKEEIENNDYVRRSELIEQEHRLHIVIGNFYNSFSWKEDDPRKVAARKAFTYKILHFLFFRNTLLAAGIIGGIISVGALVWQNFLIIDQNKDIKIQTDTTQDMYKSQIDEYNRQIQADQLTRKTELLQIIYNPNHIDKLNKSPIRSSAIEEILSNHATIEHSPISILDISSTIFSNVNIQKFYFEELFGNDIDILGSVIKEFKIKKLDLNNINIKNNSIISNFKIENIAVFKNLNIRDIKIKDFKINNGNISNSFVYPSELTDANIYNNEFEKTDFYGAYDGVSISQSLIKNSNVNTKYLRKIDVYDSRFENVEFYEFHIKDSEIRDSKFYNCAFDIFSTDNLFIQSTLFIRPEFTSSGHLPNFEQLEGINISYNVVIAFPRNTDPNILEILKNKGAIIVDLLPENELIEKYQDILDNNILEELINELYNI